MRQTIRRGVVCALLALPLSLAHVAPAGAAGASAEHRSAIQSLVRAAHAHRSVTAYFASGAVMRVDGRRVRGTQAMAWWWQGQYRAGLQLRLQSPVAVRGSRAAATLRLTTRAGACRSGCLEQTSWQLSGTRIASMTLKRISQPGSPRPPGTVPSPPSAPPKTTPTIPT